VHRSSSDFLHASIRYSMRRLLLSGAWVATLVPLRSLADVCAGVQCLNGATCAVNQTDTTKFYCDCVAGYEGTYCGTDTDDCAFSPCVNATCVDLVNDYRCECKHGWSGKNCETHDYWTLQQWTGNECGGQPWRCFKLQMDKCIDTGFVDGNVPNRKNWYGKLSYDNVTLKYTIDLCWGKDEDDEEESCKCDNHFTKIPRLGKNSLGPFSSPDVVDSDRCHKLKQVTSSRLINSTAYKANDDTENDRNRDCRAPQEALATRVQGIMATGFLAAVLISTMRDL